MRQNLLDQVVIVVALSVQKPELAEAGQHHLLKMVNSDGVEECIPDQGTHLAKGGELLGRKLL